MNCVNLILRKKESCWELANYVLNYTYLLVEAQSAARRQRRELG